MPIDGVKVIAMTPCGRKRYVELLAGHIKREVERGHIDEWILFRNSYHPEDVSIPDQLKAHFPWVTVFNKQGINYQAGTIADFFSFMTQKDNCVYFRFDDDIVYIGEDAIERTVKFRLANPDPFLVFPTIVNNVRTSHYMQQAGVLPENEFGRCDFNMFDANAWTNDRFIHKVHLKALAAIEAGKLDEAFRMDDRFFKTYEEGYISINSFCIFGEDMYACKDHVHRDEERYLSVWRPEECKRKNAQVGNAPVVHFAYHKQTNYMDRTGMLNDYVRLAPPLGFRVIQTPNTATPFSTNSAPAVQHRPPVNERPRIIRRTPAPLPQIRQPGRGVKA